MDSYGSDPTTHGSKYQSDPPPQSRPMSGRGVVEDPFHCRYPSPPVSYVITTLPNGLYRPSATPLDSQDAVVSQGTKKKPSSLDGGTTGEQQSAVFQDGTSSKKRRITADTEETASSLILQPPPANKVRKTSKLAARLAKVPGPTGANRGAKGSTLINATGQLEWRASENEAWSKPIDTTNLGRSQLLIDV